MSTTQLTTLLRARNIKARVFLVIKRESEAMVSISSTSEEIRLTLCAILHVDRVRFV